MPGQDLHQSVRVDPLLRGRRLLFVLILTVSLTLVGIGAIALFCAFAVAPISHGPSFMAQFTVLEGFFYANQPAKTVAYQAGCVAIPFLMALGFWLGLRAARRLPDRAVDRINGWGIVLYLALMLACGIPIIYCPHPPFWMLPPSWIILPFTYSAPFFSPARVLLLLLAAGLLIYFAKARASRRNANRAFLVLLTLWALLVPSRFYPPSEIGDELRYVYHLNSVLDAASQSVNGHHLLVDFPHIYGGYIEILAPFIRLFPRDIGTLIAAMGIPNVLGMLALLVTTRLVIRRPTILLVCGLAQIGVGVLSSAVDLTYGYTTARLFFVPVGILAAAHYFRGPNSWRYGAATAIAAIASIWNLDTGVVFWASWLGTLAVMALARRDFSGAARHVLVQALSLAAAWIGFFLYLRIASGQWPDVSLLFYFQTLVVGAGYFCLRILFPDMWVYIVILYLIGLAVVIRNLVVGKGGWMTPVVLMLSMLGIGLFSYFMGRSAPSNLIGVAYPAVLLAGIFCAQADLMIRRRELPSNARFFLIPTRIALLWWSLLMVAALPDLTATSARVVHNWRSRDGTPLRANAAFVAQHVQPHEKGVYILSDHSGIFYYLSDTVRDLKVPGTIELLRARDMNAVLDAIRGRQIKKLFVEQNFFDIDMYRPDVADELRQAIRENYRESAVGPTGLLVLYTPR